MVLIKSIVTKIITNVVFILGITVTGATHIVEDALHVIRRDPRIFQSQRPKHDFLFFLLYSDKMNKKRLTIIFLSGILILSSCYFILRIIDNKIVVPEKSLPKIEYSKVGGALTAMEMVGEEKMRKESSIIDLLNEMALYDTDNWEKIEKTQLEIDILEQEHLYRRDVYLQYSILYDLQRYGKSYFGYMFSHLCTPQGVPKGLFANYKSEIEKQKNEAELLREDLINEL